MTEQRNDNFFELLLVEDNAADILLLREAIGEIGMNIHLHVVQDGEEAMKYLHQHDPYPGSVLPDLILLDLNLPRKNGFGILADIKTDEDLKEIPVIVLSTSRAEEDVSRSYRLHANCFISKPANLEEFMDVIRNIGTFWLDTARLPKHKPPI